MPILRRLAGTLTAALVVGGVTATRIAGVRALADERYVLRVEGPLHLLGENDPAIPLDLTKRSVGQRCGLDQTVALKTYPGMNHRELIHASFRTQMKWIEDRFAGRPAERVCPIQ